jgi:hypothetical protein
MSRKGIVLERRKSIEKQYVSGQSILRDPLKKA